MGNDKEVRLIDANSVCRSIVESIRCAEEWANEAKEQQDTHGLRCATEAKMSLLAMLARIHDEPTVEEEALPLQVVTSEYMLQGYLVSDDYFECPSCSYEFGKTEDVMKKVHLLKLFKELNFCPKCGQKLMRNDNGNLCYRENK